MTTETSERSDLAAIRRVTPEEAWSMTSEGSGVLVDTRPRHYFDEAHAEGAISIPFDDIRRNPAEAVAALPSEHQVVFYCT